MKKILLMIALIATSTSPAKSRTTIPADEIHRRALQALINAAGTTTLDPRSDIHKHETLASILTSALLPGKTLTITTSMQCLGNSYDGTDDCTFFINSGFASGGLAETAISFELLRDKDGYPETIIGKPFVSRGH